MSTEAEIRAKLRAMEELSFEHEDGYKCLTQFAVESSGLNPEDAERWIEENGGHLKHIRIPEHIAGRDFGDPPDSAPCYFIPLSVFT